MPAKVSYLATLYYQATNTSSVHYCSAQTDRKYLATAPGNKKNDTVVPCDKNCSCQLKQARYDLMIQKVPAKILFTSF